MELQTIYGSSYNVMINLKGKQKSFAAQRKKEMESRGDKTGSEGFP